MGGRVFGRGGSLKTGTEAGIWEGGGEGGSWGGDRDSLGSFSFLFLNLAATLPGLGWKSGSSGSESFSGEGEGVCRKKCGIVGSRGIF